MNTTDLDRLWRSPADALPDASPNPYVTEVMEKPPLAVWSWMDGSIRINDRWLPFEAQEVIHVDRGFIWQARTRMLGLPVRGSDRWLDGAGSMDWRLLGVLPVAQTSGVDVSRSARQRMLAEAVLWLPSILSRPDAAVKEVGDRLDVTLDGTVMHLGLEDGEASSIVLDRWGDPDGTGFASHPFGGHLEGHRRFEGVRIPTQVEVGWFFGTPRWDDGVFFRATVREARFRWATDAS